jgi:hypothetical protein
VPCPRQDGLTGAKTIHASRTTLCFLGYPVMGCSANACYRGFVKQTKRVEVIDEIPILVHQANIRDPRGILYTEDIGLVETVRLSFNERSVKIE